MAGKEEQTVGQLFAEVENSFADGEFGKALKAVNKILRELPNDVDAKKCKIVCLIQQSNFQEAVDSINSNEKKGVLAMPFEKAYCLYRLNKLREADKVLSAIAEPGLKEKELLAQVKYRLESYKDCLGLYHELMRHSQDDYSDEREANMIAVVAAAKMWDQQDIDAPVLREDASYEINYNYSCLLMARGELQTASDKLNHALLLCRKNFEGDDDMTEEEIEEETLTIRAQLAYIVQLSGKTDEALTQYNQILKSKPSDIALTAVVSNNVVAIHKEKDLFDSKKRLRAMNVAGLENKMTKSQQQTMEINKCLLNMFMNQIDACKKSLTKLKTQFPGTQVDAGKSAILEAAVHLRDKHPDQAMDHLQALINSGVASDDIRLTLAQLQLTKGRLDEAIMMLESVSNEIRYSPALISLLVSLVKHIGDREKAGDLIDKAVEFADQNRAVVKRTHLLTLLKESASAKMASGDIAKAIETLERLRKEDPTDVKTLAKIVAAYSKTDLKKAYEYSTDLPEFSIDNKKVDLDSLEMVDMIGSFRFSKKTAIAEQVADVEAGGPVVIANKEASVKTPKARKKKKGRMPKSFDPEVDPDPERWLPRWERSTFKHKKQKRGAQPSVGKGTQGSAESTSVSAANNQASPRAAAAAVDPGSPKPSPGGAATATSSGAPPTSQAKPQAKSKQKSKKKGKGGW